MAAISFVEDARLGIPLPALQGNWDDIPIEERIRALAEWEQIRGRIPDQIIRLERQIIEKQTRMDQEEDFRLCCELNADIAELASRITDLHLWYRTQQDLATDGEARAPEDGKRHG
ncbi:hypothetical protein ACFQWB_15585 [Paenibacillus thermoaerophilus]|uniref:Uncharacterized protein n=1 Tax=Paenibacillus thermoaerophilus TaxID=1215385 RepID=A0ABW2V980_9BACL|nr:hypothetical protein [Paenibacillus thermoaerophilus]